MHYGLNYLTEKQYGHAIRLDKFKTALDNSDIDFWDLRIESTEIDCDGDGHVTLTLDDVDAHQGSPRRIASVCCTLISSPTILSTVWRM